MLVLMVAPLSQFAAETCPTETCPADLAAASLVALVILNFNGQRLLAECLPTVMAAAAQSRHACSVVVIDNDSTDDSVAWLKRHWPAVRVVPCRNRGLCSYNDVLSHLNCQVAVLLNNDIKLAATAVDPLVAPLLPSSKAYSPDCFMAAPLCWLFDGQTYEGLKTALRWRWGLVQATALFPGHEHHCHQPDWTASAGAVLAVERRRFLELGGFDPLYLPGRLEDLDFAFRGYQAGYHARYVPESVAFHQGQGSFGPAFGERGNQQLALRNTLLFQWKNLRHPRHLVRHVAGLLMRLARDVLRAPLLPKADRFGFTRALAAAWCRAWVPRDRRFQAASSWRRERDYFNRFDYRRMARGSLASR